MSYFSSAEFYSSYLPTYFADRFQTMCREKNSGCIDDIDANWNIFIFVDNFINFISSLNLDQQALKCVLENNFIIPIEDYHSEKIHNSLINKSISTIIVNGLSQSSIPIVQLMFRFHLVEACGLQGVNYDELSRLLFDARIKAEHFEANYFVKQFKYVLLMCLERCRDRDVLKFYRILFDEIDLLDTFKYQLNDVERRIGEVKPKSEVKVEVKTEETEDFKKVPVGLKTPPKKKLPQKSPKKIKQNFNIREFMSESVLPNAKSAQKFVKTKTLTRPEIEVPPRTINEITRKKFIPRRSCKINPDCTTISPSSLRNRNIPVSMKRSHSSLFTNHNQLDIPSNFNGNCLVSETPVVWNKTVYRQGTVKNESSVALNFDISPKKRTKRS